MNTRTILHYISRYVGYRPTSIISTSCHGIDMDVTVPGECESDSNRVFRITDVLGHPVMVQEL